MTRVRAREAEGVDRSDRAYRQLLTIVSEEQRGMLEKLAVRYVAPEHFAWGLILVVALMWQRVFDQIYALRGDMEQNVTMRALLSEHREEQMKLLAALSAKVDALSSNATRGDASARPLSSSMRQRAIVPLLAAVVFVLGVAGSYRLGEQHGRASQSATDVYVARHEAARWRHFVDSYP